MRRLLLLSLSGIVFAGCASTSSASSGKPAEGQHGRMSTLSAATSENAEFCEHRIPKHACVKCHPELAQRFKDVGDWCAEHDVPESQCYLCHPDLSFAPPPALPEGADVAVLSAQGEDVPSLNAHAVKGKVTVFDFYADWCAPCRELEHHLIAKLRAGEPIAYRKLNVVSWETPLAKRHLAKVPNLPYVVVYGRDGNIVSSISGFDTAALDKAIAEGASR